MKEDNRGEFYSNGYCTVLDSDCNSNLKGACGVCLTGGTYRNTISQLIFKGSDSILERALTLESFK